MPNRRCKFCLENVPPIERADHQRGCEKRELHAKRNQNYFDLAARMRKTLEARDNQQANHRGFGQGTPRDVDIAAAAASDPSIIAFEDLISQCVRRLCSAADKIGGIVLDVTKVVKDAFSSQKELLIKIKETKDEHALPYQYVHVYKDGQIITSPATHVYKDGQIPWLVYYHGKGYKKQSFCYDITGPSPVKTHIKSIPVLRDNTLILPDLHHLWNHKIDSCVLLLLPPGGNLTLLIFFKELPSIMLCRVGETKWSEISYGKYLEPFFVEELHTIARENGSPLFFRRAVGFGGKVYAQLGADWLDGFCYSMMSIEIVEEGAAEFGLVLRTVNGPADMRSGCFTPYINVYMLESCGELFLIHFSSGALVFEVYRMNFDTMAWERMKSIKDATFFIGENYCFSCPTSGSGDRIYFTRRKDHRLYCYNMEDGSVVMSSPRPAIPTPWPSPPIWMMPQLTLSIKDELASGKNFDAAMQTSPVFFNDAFYYLDKMGRLGCLEIDLQLVNIRWEVLEKPQRPADLKFFSHNFLVECGGELISVFLGRAGKWVYVYKLNNCHQVWEKVSNLGGYDLYLNPTSSSAMPSSSGGNRIYFPLLRGTNIVYFSMETGKWHFSGSQQDSSSHLYGTRWYPNSCWIKPCW
ncbi:unnamed protein product [Cuscuta campestris]|uniref:KIB1-4 beta-propeller domain-containing protein n=1 Tax=Cuscuta campestris TaxID=132261 RepID=A0A484L6M8_9ASTE|nr:unnamed protein product [Cuscuta campestris]